MSARTDLVADPAIVAGLLQARRGQAYFSRRLHELRDEDLDAPSLLPGWSRRHVAAHVGFNARAIARLVEWAATGVESPMYESAEQRWSEIDLGATLPVQAIRNLSDHAAIHLSVCWRDLPADRWAFPVVTAQGRIVPVSETVWMRAREVWLHAIDLDGGGRFSELPADVVDALLDDLLAVWRRKRAGTPTPNIVVMPTDRHATMRLVDDEPDDLVVSGTAADLVAWGTGRRSHGVMTPSGAEAPPAPPWL